jgi:hypothetical protein
MKWITSAVMALLCDPKWSIEAVGQGGDWDTNNLVINLLGNENNRLFIRGFNPKNTPEVTTPDDAEIEMVEVTDGGDSRGGWNIYEREFGNMYVEVCVRLNEAGYLVVPCMDEYH